MSDATLGQDIEELLEVLEGSGFSTCAIEDGPQRLFLRRPVAVRPPVEPVEAGPEQPARPPVDPRVLLTSPRVGHFYPRQGRTSGAKYRKGDRIEAGEVYGTIEAMHLKYELRAERPGVLDEFLAAEGEAVEYGQPLLALEVEE